MDLTDPLYGEMVIRRRVSRLFVLWALSKGPLHGCELARNAKAYSDGYCAPTSGTVYPVLREMTKGNYVTRRAESVGGRKRHIYTLTEKRQRAYQVAIEAWTPIAARVIQMGEEGES